MEDILKAVYEFAANAHKGQMRKYTPDPYIVHPVRVMETCRLYDPKVSILSAALLHDVLEDTEVTKDEMSTFLQQVMPDDAEKTLQLVVELTDVYVKSAYPELNRRRRKDKEIERMSKISSDAQTIKYADISDNVKEIASDDPGFAPRYIAECMAILKKIDRGNPVLYAKALDAVSTAARSVKNKSRTNRLD